MYAKYLVFILVVSIQAGLARADAPTIATTQTYQSLAAHYQITRRTPGAHQAVADWYFTRQKNQIEMARGDYAEVWQRDSRGELTLTRVFQGEHKLIQYTPGELRTQGRQKDWSDLNNIFDPRQHAGLQRVGRVSVLGRPALRYTGKIGEERIEVWWLPTESLAAKIIHANRDDRLTLTLKAIRTTPDVHWPAPSLARADTYAYLDAADLGDMEYDPFVQSVLSMDDGRPVHAHHPLP